MKNMKSRIKKYLEVVPLTAPETRQLLIETTLFRPRPLIAKNDDYEMCMSLRVAMTEDPSCFMPTNAREFTDKIFLIHLFLTRYGTSEHSYLPVAAQGRSYSYIDSKTVTKLLPSAKAKFSVYEDDVNKSNPAWREAQTKQIKDAREKENAMRRKNDEKASLVATKLQQRTDELCEKISMTTSSKKNELKRLEKEEKNVQRQREKLNASFREETERRAKYDEKEAEKVAMLAEAIESVKPVTPTLGELIGSTPEQFNARRKDIIKRIRKSNTEKIKSKSFLPEGKRKAFKKAAKHRKKVGFGKMDPNSRFDSLKTDAVGLRLTIKTPVPIDQYVIEITTDVLPIEVKIKAKAKPEKMSKKQREIMKLNASEAPVQGIDPMLQDAIVVGIDEGRAKCFTSAVLKSRAVMKFLAEKVTATQESESSQECSSFFQGLLTTCIAIFSAYSFVTKKAKNLLENKDQKNCDYDDDVWQTTTLTRNKYNAVTKLKIRRKFEQERMRQNPDVKIAHDAMSNHSLRTCDPETWKARIQTENAHKDALRNDYFADVEREKWRMVAFRKKKSCLDRAVGDMIKQAIAGEPKSRPLVIGIGDAAFPANGPRGETAVPTSKLAAAYKRAITNLKKTGRRVATFPISEHYTTKACCQCGATTSPPESDCILRVLLLAILSKLEAVE